VSYSGGRGSGRDGSFLGVALVRVCGHEPLSLSLATDAGGFPKFRELRRHSLRRNLTRVTPI
jgi:hypothetical protein